MENIIQKVKDEIKDMVTTAIKNSVKEGLINIEVIPEIEIEEPKEKQHGDLAINTAMVMAKEAKMAPKKIAEIIVSKIDISNTFIERIEIAGPGFINFFLKDKFLEETLKLVYERGKDYGRVNIGNDKKVQVEFVSANPTGPMHMGNARGGALGDALAAVLDYAGYDVTREFYINDAGNQIEKFGYSLEARYLQLLGIPAEVPEGGYHGEDIIDRAREFFRNIQR